MNLGKVSMPLLYRLGLHGLIFVVDFLFFSQPSIIVFCEEQANLVKGKSAHNETDWKKGEELCL